MNSVWFSFRVHCLIAPSPVPGFGTISSFFPTKEQMFGILFGAVGSSTTFSDNYNYTTVIKKVRE